MSAVECVGVVAGRHLDRMMPWRHVDALVGRIEPIITTLTTDALRRPTTLFIGCCLLDKVSCIGMVEVERKSICWSTYSHVKAQIKLTGDGMSGRPPCTEVQHGEHSLQENRKQKQTM